MHHARVLTLRAAANLLAQADSLAALRPLAHTLGFPDPPIRVNADARRELTLADLVTDAEVARGPGTLRLLTATLAPPTTNIADARDLTRRLCSVLLRQAPTRLWCVIALDHTRRTVCIATVSPHSNGPRIAALRVDRERVVDSDAETLRALATIPDQLDGLRHARFIDILKRDALSSRFYRALDNTVRLLATTATGSASASERHELALLCTSRCLFLSFLEAKGWLDGDHNFLLRHATTRLELGGRIHERLLRPLFFGTLNTPRTHRAPAAHAFGAVPFLNGGLFSPTPLERARHAIRFNDDALVALIGDLLDRYRFTAREDSTAWSEAAVDPEMLGRSFECLMATDERRRSGSFYTPPALVEQVVRDALEAALPALPPDALRTEHSRLNLSPSRTQQLRNEIVALRVLDPACGSGAFLVHTMERLAVLLLRCGDARPVHLLRQEILSRTVFGVDRNPMAVWLCELRLWLSVVIECPETQAVNVPPLPNLDHHIRVGDALAGGDFQFAPPSARVLGALRERYTRATGRRKQSLATALDREERTRAVAETKRRIAATAHERRGLVQGIRTRDLFGERARRTAADARRLAALRANQRELAAQQHRLELGAALPFRFTSCFADVAAAGGFSLVVGNPPWVRPHALPLAERQRLRLEFRTIRNAAWSAGAKRAGAATGFAAQADLAVAFVLVVLIR